MLAKERLKMLNWSWPSINAMKKRDFWLFLHSAILKLKKGEKNWDSAVCLKKRLNKIKGL